MGAVATLLQQTFAAEVTACPEVAEAIRDVSPALAPEVPPPWLLSGGPSVASDPAHLPKSPDLASGSVVLQALQAVSDARDFRLGAIRARQGKLVTAEPFEPGNVSRSTPDDMVSDSAGAPSSAAAPSVAEAAQACCRKEALRNLLPHVGMTVS